MTSCKMHCKSAAGCPHLVIYDFFVPFEMWTADVWLQPLQAPAKRGAKGKTKSMATLRFNVFVICDSKQTLVADVPSDDCKSWTML